MHWRGRSVVLRFIRLGSLVWVWTPRTRLEALRALLETKT